MSGATETQALAETPVARPRQRAGIRWRRGASTAGWYAILVAMAVVTVFPFAWMLLTSFKGPADSLTSVPPQFLPSDPTLANYERVLKALPIPSFFVNSVIV
jgi:ABC-type glycerol-3-phosphate transport system permease component